MPTGHKGRPQASACEHTDRPHAANGVCKSCYAKARYCSQHPDVVPRDTPSLDRFNARVREQPNGCWLWTGAKKSPSQGSYPLFYPGNKLYPCHAVKWAYENIRGLKAPKRGDGVELSHTCETGSRCCNPWHVVEESHRDNMLRIPERKRKRICREMRKHIKPETLAGLRKPHCLRGHARTPDNLGKRCPVCKLAAEKERYALNAWAKALTRAVGNPVSATDTR